MSNNPSINDFNSYEDYLQYRKNFNKAYISKTYGVKNNSNTDDRGSVTNGGIVNWTTIPNDYGCRVHTNESSGYVYYSPYTNAKISSLVG
jgi:hypothetical protein